MLVGVVYLPFKSLFLHDCIFFTKLQRECFFSHQSGSFSLHNVREQFYVLTLLPKNATRYTNRQAARRTFTRLFDHPPCVRWHSVARELLRFILRVSYCVDCGKSTLKMLLYSKSKVIELLGIELQMQTRNREENTNVVKLE